MCARRSSSKSTLDRRGYLISSVLAEQKYCAAVSIIMQRARNKRYSLSVVPHHKTIAPRAKYR